MHYNPNHKNPVNTRIAEGKHLTWMDGVRARTNRIAPPSMCTETAQRCVNKLDNDNSNLYPPTPHQRLGL